MNSLRFYCLNLRHWSSLRFHETLRFYLPYSPFSIPSSLFSILYEGYFVDPQKWSTTLTPLASDFCSYGQAVISVRSMSMKGHHGELFQKSMAVGKLFLEGFIRRFH